MTITLKPWMTVLLIATICVLAGFAIGQVTSAQSAKDASASARAQKVKDAAVLTQLKKLNRAIGSPSGITSRPETLVRSLADVRAETEKVADNTYWMCRELAAAPHACK